MEQHAAPQVLDRIAASDPLGWMARIGYVARGTVFMIVGVLALLAAGGGGERPQGVSDALRTLFAHPFGAFLLWAVAAGLACFAGWRFLQSFFDADRHGRSPYGLMRRGVFAISGVFYLALAGAIARVAVGFRALSEDQSARDWTRWLMAQPLGRVLIALIGAVFIGMAAGLAVKVCRAPYRRRLDPQRTSRAWAVALGSFGILTRAFVFLMIGAFLCFAAYDSNAREVVGFTGVLRTLQRQSYGWLLLGIAALGLLAFGGFEIVLAWARRVRTPTHQ